MVRYYNESSRKTVKRKHLPFELVYLVAAFGWIAFGGCQYDPHAHLLATSKPLAKHIPGTYVVDRIYLPERTANKKLDMKVEIREDGTFTATNIPPWNLDEPDKDFLSVLQSGQGKWEISEMGTLDPGSHQLWGIYFRTNDNRFHPANFTGNKPPYGLIFTLGDPDSGHAIILKKK
jgi:hypothetical protein